MSEPTPKPPETKRPAVRKAAKDGDKLQRQIPVAKPLEAETKKEAAPSKSSVVLSQSYRVVELPPPPVAEPPAADRERGS